jgi:hypothetical protein
MPLGEPLELNNDPTFPIETVANPSPDRSSWMKPLGKLLLLSKGI